MQGSVRLVLRQRFFNSARTTYFCMRMTQVDPSSMFYGGIFTTYLCMRGLSRVRKITK